jgi:stage II sporulation protein AA (anti-sigma F factor antagonist)
MDKLARIQIRTEADIVVATINGEIDLSNTEDLERSIVGSVPNTARGVVVDMSGTTYIDSSGIRLLFALASRARVSGQSMLLVAPEGSRVRRVLTVAGAEEALPIHTTAEAARRGIMSELGIDP